MKSTGRWKALMALGCLFGMPALIVPPAWGQVANLIAHAEKMARQHKDKAFPASWQAPFPGVAPDLMLFVDDKRILIGSVELGEREFAAPQYGKLVLYDTVSGKKLWEAARRNLPRGDYSTIVTPSALVLLASLAGSLDLSAYDPASGARRWQHSVRTPAHVEPTEDGRSLLVLSMDGRRYQLERLDSASGRRLWTRALAEELREPAPSPALYLDGDDVLVVGKHLTRIGGQDGGVKRSDVLPLGETGEGESTRIPGGIWAWNTSSMAMLDGDGKARWSHAVEAGTIKQAAYGADLAYRLLRVPSGEISGDEVVQGLDPASGKIEWSQSIPGATASSLLMAEGLLLLTVDNGIMGLDAKSGALRFRTAFPEWFHQATPSAVGGRGQRDLLQIRGGNVYVARERAGVAAYDLAAGRQLWIQASQEIISGIYPTYSTVASTTRLRGLVGTQIGAVPSQVLSGRADTAASQMYIRSAEQRIQTYEASRQQAMARHDTGKAIMYGNLQSIEMSMQRFHGQMALAQNILNGTVALADFLAKAASARVWESTTLPKVLELRNAARLQRSVFQDGYYVRPFWFLFQGRGLTIVELATGKRHDLIYSPPELLPPWVDMPAFVVGAGPRIYTVGPGFDIERFEPHVVRGARLVRPSLLAFDLKAMPFVDKNEALETALAAIPGSWKTNMMQWAGHCNIFHVRRELDAVEAANPQHAAGLKNGALMFAAMDGCTDVVRLMLQRGADVNAVNQGGRTALDMAADEPTRQLLTKAGGKRMRPK